MLSSLHSIAVSSSLPMDLTDLVRGEGEWRNMQEVIRKTFKITFLQLERQQEQIEKLMGVTSTLREALSTKMTEKEVELLLATRLRDTKKGPKEDMAIMMHQLSEIKAEVERKASLRYVDDSLRRKVDKSDVLVRTSQSIQTSQAASNAFAGFNAEVTKLSGEVGSLRGKFDGMEKLLADQNDRIRSSATTGDMLGVQNQLNQLYKAVQECPRKEEIVRIYDKKVDRREFEKALLDKADKSSVTSSFARIEDVLGEQERTLTATRLKVNDLLISKSTKEPSAVGFTEQILSPIKPIHKSQQYQNKSAPLDENFSESRMQDGRTDALLNGMWQKVVQMQRDLERAQFDYRDTDGKITALQETLKSVITVEERDVILSSIKEVARRLDSILNGVLPIKPIESMLTDLSEKIQDIQGFLHLPQAKPLRSQFGELKNMLDQIEHRVTEISQYPISRIQDRLDKVEDAQVSLESHMRQVESASKGMETRFDEKLTSNIHLIKNKLRETVSPSKRNLVDDMQDDVREMKSALARIEQDRRGRWSAQRASEVMTEVIARQTNLEEKFIRLKSEVSSATQRSVKELCEQVMTARNRALRKSSKESSNPSRVRFEGITSGLSDNNSVGSASSSTGRQPLLPGNRFTEDSDDVLNESVDELGLRSSDLEFAGIDTSEMQALDSRLKELQREKQQMLLQRRADGGDA